ncbi:hypothetical protein E0Z10_g8687 [Xylaria hypoxylon]|uniref:2EXR domain-containing protein n=1 Tax=Xylaria hypoxylon TaxID=37992 RepID=A0A4Z0YJ21_9PEZI|nr:hypothetical protein E0Z10_g8687 [Xylaria hypoxylon]
MPGNAKREEIENQNSPGPAITDEPKPGQEDDGSEGASPETTESHPSTALEEVSYQEAPPDTAENLRHSIPLVDENSSVCKTARSTSLLSTSDSSSGGVPLYGRSHRHSMPTPRSALSRSASATGHYDDLVSITSRSTSGANLESGPDHDIRQNDNTTNNTAKGDNNSRFQTLRPPFPPLSPATLNRGFMKVWKRVVPDTAFSQVVPEPTPKEPVLTATKNYNTAKGTLGSPFQPRLSRLETPPASRHVVSASAPEDPVIAAPRFPLVPIELRLMMWNAHLSDARVVILYAYAHGPELECSGEGGRGKSAPRVPVVISPNVLRFINPESRREDASRTFTIQRYPSKNPSIWKTWMDPSQDWLCIDPWDGSFSGRNPGRANIRFWYDMDELASVAQNIAIIDRLRSKELWSWLARAIFNKIKFPQTKRLAIVHHIFTLHAPPEKAWAAGLFHREDTHTLVDISDIARLRKFYDFYLLMSLRQRQSTLSILEVLLQPHSLLVYKKTLMREMHKLFHIASSNITWPDLILQPHNSGNNLGVTRQEPIFLPGEPSHSTPPGFPKIELMVMFRLCAANVCDEDTVV